MKLTDIKGNGVFWLSCVVAFSMPFSKQVAGIAIGLLFLTGLFNLRHRELDKEQKMFFWILIAFYLIHVASLIYTQNIRSGLLHVEMKLSLLAFPLIFALNPRLDRRKVELVLACFVCAMIIACLVSLSYALYRYHYEVHVYKQNIFFFYYNDLSDPFDLDPAYYSLYVGFASLLLTIYLIDNTTRLNAMRIFLISAAAALLTGFNILLSARMPLLVYLAILIFVLCARVRIRSWIGYAVIAVFLGAMVLFISQNKYTLNRISQVDRLTYDIENPDFKAWNGITTRVAIWLCGMEVIRNNFIFGVGRGDSENELLDVYRERKFHYALREKYNMHNQYLQTLLGVGIIGLGILLVSLAIPFKVAFQRRDWYYIVFLCMIILCFLTESTLARLKGVLFYAFFNSLLFFYLQKHNR